ncbi:MAG: hypothetical protein DRH56_11005 [Deltaproteobacteria bacterium]|nr:MAG: hypothetical protein DRH56_11005 [Deltaproteobacteria bacterium]
MLNAIYKKEFETTAISLPDLHLKYDIDTPLQNTDTWVKTFTLPISVQTEPSSITNTSLVDYDRQQDVDKAKQLIMKEVLSKLVHDINDMEIREFKDIVSIVDSMDDKKAEDKSVSVNILIQNLVKGFSDDC